MATRRSAGQPAIRSASSFSLAKVSNGVVVVAAASSAVANDHSEAIEKFCVDSGTRRNGDAQRPTVLRSFQMTGHGAKFGRKKEEAVLALLTHPNLEQAARSINIAPRTLMRWMKVNSYGRVGSAPSSYRIGPFAAQLIASR